MKKLLSLLALVVFATSISGVYAQEAEAPTDAETETVTTTEATETNADGTEAVEETTETEAPEAKEINLDLTEENGQYIYKPSEAFNVKNTEYFYLQLDPETNTFDNIYNTSGIEHAITCVEDTQISGLTFEEYLTNVNAIEDAEKKATCRSEILLILTSSEVEETTVNAGDELFVTDKPIAGLRLVASADDGTPVTVVDFTLTNKTVTEEVTVTETEEAPAATEAVDTKKTGLSTNILIILAIMTIAFSINYARRND